MERKLAGPWLQATKAVSVGFALFILFTGAFGALPHMQQRSLFVLITLVLTFALYPATKSGISSASVPWWDLILILLTLITAGNIVLNWEYYLRAGSDVSGFLEYGSAAVLLLLVFEAARRSSGSSGLIIIAIVALAILYTFLGPWIPGLWGHRGFSYSFFLQILYQSDMALWGPIVGVIASMVSIFILFGAILHYSGGGKTFIDLACLLMGRYRGGPALVAVFSSALFGMLSGSAVANVATTGNFTIPLMKRLGYRPEFAAAVESTASTGGQVMPPIMSAAAFIMAELLDIPYFDVIKAAFIPAFLYFAALFCMVLNEAARLNLPPIPKKDMPDKKALLSWSRLSPFILPVVVLTGFLVRGYDPYRACLYSIVIAVLLYLTIDFSPAGWANRIKDLMAALEKGVDSLLSFMSLIVLCSVLVGVLTLTGITPKITGTILVIAGHNLFAALVFGAVATLFLGMGLPTPAAYIVGASVIAPSLIQLGIKPITAHLFVLYYAVISNLTPPVCIAAVVASIIADADWFKASLSAMKLGVIGYLVPFLMVYRSTFIMEGSAGSILFTVVTALIGILFLSAGFFGYLKTKLSVGSRLFLIPSGFFFILPTFAASLVGAGLGALSFAIIWFHDWRRQGKVAA